MTADDAQRSRRRRMAAGALIRSGTTSADSTADPIEAPLTPEQEWLVETATICPDVEALSSVAEVVLPTKLYARIPTAVERALAESDAPGLQITRALGAVGQTGGGVAVRTTITRADDTRTVLRLSANRLFVDRWSCLMLAARVAELVHSPGPSRAKPSFLRYSTAADRRPRAGIETTAGMDLVSPTRLPYDGERAGVPVVTADWLRDSVDWETVLSATPDDCSPRATILAAVVAGVARLGGSDTIRVGVVERMQDAAGMVGCCTSTRILTCAVSATQPFSDLVRQCANRPEEAPHLREVLRAAGDVGPVDEPTVSVGVEFVDQIDVDPDLPHPVLLGGDCSLFEFMLTCHQTPKRIELICEYRTGLLTKATVHQFLATWKGLLTAAVVHAGTPLELIPLPSAIHGLPSSVRSPSGREEAAALQFAADNGELSSSYELTTSTSILNDLRAAGVGETSTVALVAAESVKFAQTLLAALELGADVVVLDPSDPAPWQRRVVERVRADMLVEPGGAISRIARFSQRRRSESAALLVVMSSGHRGRIVWLPHAALLAAADAAATIWCLQAGDGLAHSASWASEDAVVALYAAVRHGTTLLRIPSTLTGPPLLDALEASEVAVADLDEHHLHSIPLGLLPDLRAVARAPDGAATDNSTMIRWWSPMAPHVQAAGRDLMQLYGSVPPGTSSVARVATISGLALPANRSGRLWVAAWPGTRFLDDAQTTAITFRPDPEGSGGQLFDTEVLARTSDESRIVVDALEPDRAFLSGRSMLSADLTEVIANSVETPAEFVAGVVPGDWRVGRCTYAAYGSTVPIDVLTDRLHAALPKVLVPRAVSRLDENIRLDTTHALRLVRRALSNRPELAPPRLGLETELAEQVFVPQLRVPDPGRTESVFGLGASSLQVLRMLTVVNELYRVEVSVAEFLRAPHIAGMAAAVQHRLSEQKHLTDQLNSVLEVVETED